MGVELEIDLFIFFFPESQLQDFQKPPLLLQPVLLFFMLKNYITHHLFKKGKEKEKNAHR